jgi:hypothetical protein
MTTAIDARDRLRAALYRTGRPQYDGRCDTCTHCDATPLRCNARYCARHRAEVAVHGVCQAWSPINGAGA